MKVFGFFAERAICPGCGAGLDILNDEAIVTCRFCGIDSKVIRKLRKIEPDLPPCEPPMKQGDPEKDYDTWGMEQLIHGIMNEEDPEKRIAMAKALDSWPHARIENSRWIPVIIEIMLSSPGELDRALSGILGKMICSDDLELRKIVIESGWKYGFKTGGSHGLLFALSLGDAGTVKLLLDIGEWAQEKGDTEYANQALIGVQTAIGRESKRHRTCMEILLCRLPYSSGKVREWMIRFLRNHFDVGYTFLFRDVLELIDDCVLEAPDLVAPLQKAFSYCRSCKNKEELTERLEFFTRLRSVPSKISACQKIGTPPAGTTEKEVELAVSVLGPLFDDGEICDFAAQALSSFLWIESTGGIPPALQEFYESGYVNFPDVFKESYRLRISKTS